MPKKFLEITFNALVDARHSVYEKYKLSNPKEVNSLPHKIARYTLLHLIEYFESPGIKKNGGETQLLSRLQNALDDKDESIVNILEFLRYQVERLPIGFFSRDRGLIYQTFKAVTCLPSFQPYVLTRYTHRQESQLRMRVEELENADNENVSNHAASTGASWGSQEHLFRSTPPQQPQDDEAAGVAPPTTATTATASGSAN